MNNKILIITLLITACTLLPGLATGADKQKLSNKRSAASIDSSSSKTIDSNEELHLIFMREEEKLARDVYTALGMQYPDLKVFGMIKKAEERHTCSVCDKLEQYGIDDPVINDNVGVFSGDQFGWYFIEKYQHLIEKGNISELEALYVGAYIEELDMLDIKQCPKVIVATIESIITASDCGLVYTDNDDIQRLYQSLLEGSESHLRAYVLNIEQHIGEGNYQAQVLSQQQVDEILGR